MHDLTTHLCTHCGEAIRPVLRHGGRPGGRVALILGLWLAVPLAAAAVSSAALAVPALAPDAPGLAVLAAMLALGLALWAAARLLLDLAAPRQCPHCGTPRPVPLTSPRARQSSLQTR